LEGPEPASIETFKEEMIQEPAELPVSGQLASPKLEEVSPTQETQQAAAGAAPQENGMAKSETREEHLGPESSPQTFPTKTHEIKKDIAE
jgi:hypothetical protein